MDLIYTDDTKKDIGIFDAYTLDLSYGEDENDFELKIDRSAHCCKAGYYIYVEGEEYGGVIEKIKVNTKSDEVTYSGPTWQGYIDHKVLCPDPGQDYLVADGEAHEVLADLIERLDLPALFEASTEDSGITVHYQFERYVTAYKGIKAMLKDAGAKLKIKWQNGKVIMRAEQVHDYSQDEEFDTSQVEFEVSREYAPVNHVICLGKGDLADRAVIHIFTDENGGIQPYAKVKNPVEDSDYILDTSRQVITGERENVSVLEMNSAQETTNYILQTSKPSDWATKYDAYYIQDGDSYKAVAGVEVGYTLTRYQPPDWSANFGDYSTRNGDSYNKVSGTTAYTAQTSKPSDWAAKYEEYYTKGSDYESVKGVEKETYTKQTRQPSDWRKNYGNYYVLYSDGVTTEYKKVDGVSRNKYNLQTRKPTDWDTNYTSYYKRKKVGGYEKVAEREDKKIPTWKAKTYFVQESYQVAPVWKKETRYTDKKTEQTPTWKSGTYYTKQDGQAPTWKAGTYYKKSSDKVAPKWTTGTYYTKVTDQYATMVAEAVKRLQETTRDTLKIDLEETEQSYDIGDIVGAVESVTGISTIQEVTQKIVKINNDDVTITYEVS